MLSEYKYPCGIHRLSPFGDTAARVGVAIINFTDARAPFTSGRFGYGSDMHRDYGRSWYVDLRLDF